MAIAWRLEELDSNSYRFFNFTGTVADEIHIDDDHAGEPIVIPGPVDFVIGTNSFDHALGPGHYSISWRSTTGASHESRSATFTVPITGPGSALLETG
jgi:hypothetical protein